MVTGTPTAEVVGREEELASLAAFVDEVEGRPMALVLEGEAGVGKTTLWRAALRMAQESDQRVLSASGAAVETQMAFAGLADLLEPALDDVLPALPSPQRSALEATLLLEEPVSPHSPRVVSAAMLNSFRHLAADSPVLVAIDDANWLDPPTAGAIGFAVRRLRDERIALLISVRSDERPAFDVSRASFAERVNRLEVGPLSFGAMRHLLLSRTELRLTRPLLRRIHETSGGNPFFALELARALARRDSPPEPGEPLPVPADLGALLADSLERLPEETRGALLVTALLARPSLDAVTHAIERSSEEVLGPAIDANIVELVGGELRFVHPLLRSTVHAEAPASTRLRWHRRLVATSPDPEERAGHLALVSFTPDESVAGELESGGVRAYERGATAVAAGLLEQAARLTPEERVDERARRALAAADARLESGDRRRAIELWEQVRATIPHGPLRADALRHLAETGTAETVEQGITLSTEALAEAAGDALREVEVLLQLANLEHARGGSQAAVDYATRALRIADGLRDETTVSVLTALGIYETFLGVGDPLQRYTEAIELAGSGPRPVNAGLGRVYWEPETMLSDWRMKNGEVDEARSLLEEQYRRAVEAGDEESRFSLCFHLGPLETLAGCFDAAERWIEEGQELVEESEARQDLSTVFTSTALLDAYRGHVERARASAARAIANAEAWGDTPSADSARATLCFIELSRGRPDEALAELGPSVHRLLLSTAPKDGDRVEPLIGVGRLDEADEALAPLEAYSDQTGLRVFRLQALRCRGLLEAARGDVEGALVTLEGAVALAAEIQLPLERGRAWLALGRVRRRAKQKRAAREALETARDAFRGFGSPLWAEQAAAEIARIGGRTGERWELTATERRVAELVAQGLTNKEVAGQLVISVRAVEANLTRIYAKLGIRSRTELAHTLAQL